jgi:hypothetical protein
MAGRAAKARKRGAHMLVVMITGFLGEVPSDRL